MTTCLDLFPRLQRTFRKKISTPSSRSNNKFCLMSTSPWFVVWLTLLLWRWKRRMTLNGLHGVTSQNILRGLISLWLYKENDKLRYDLRLSQRWLWRMSSSGMWSCVDLALTDVSVERIASIFKVAWRWFTARGFFYPEDGSDTFHRNVS
jgi:hypothetical protein